MNQDCTDGHKLSKLRDTERCYREANRFQVREIAALTRPSLPCVAYGFAFCDGCKQYEAQADTETSLRQALRPSAAQAGNVQSHANHHRDLDSIEQAELESSVRCLEQYLSPGNAPSQLAADEATLR